MNAIVPPAYLTATALSSEAAAVRQALVKRGLETPMVPTQLSEEEKYLRLHRAFSDVLSTLGLDLSDDSLAETPNRMARMYLNELFSGLDYTHFPRVSTIDNKMGIDDVVSVDRIELLSTCEHHFVTIDGSATVAYIPAGKVLGLSKINRIVHFFARRPQVQERLNRQVLVALQTLLDTDDVAVMIEAVHYCVKSRGIMDSHSNTRTIALGGRFREDELRREFLSRRTAPAS
jgi:GTP cyclohydrolase I